MADQDLLTKTFELTGTVYAAGALGAGLRLRQTGQSGDARILAKLEAVTESIAPGLLSNADPAEIGASLGRLTRALQEALDLIREPTRPPGWSYDDPAVLQEQGRASAFGPHAFARLARQRPALAAVLAGDRRFLDVGTGSGWLAIEAARVWPGMQVVGLDIWEPALALAEANVAGEGLAHRITFRRQSVAALDDEAAFDLVWLPAMFMPRQVVETALPRLARALKPGGMLILGRYATRPGALGRAVDDLLTVRSGGEPWEDREIAAQARAAGLADAEFVDTGPVRSMLGRRATA
jgi:SAM-dependent methyltransferase